MEDETITTGDWDFAADSYGKVRHSKKAYIFSLLPINKQTGQGERIVTIAQRIPNWKDAALMAEAPTLRKLVADALSLMPLGSPARQAWLKKAGEALGRLYTAGVR